MSNIEWINVKIESLGVFELLLPVGLVGTGVPPFLTITALIHGDETAGLLTLTKFIKERIPYFKFQGTIRIIPIANPLGAITNTRVSFLDMLDMNRGGIGDPTGQITERLAYALYELVKDSTLVINLHEFEANSKLTCIFTNSGSAEVQLMILRGILAFGPEIIWSIPRPDDTALKPLPSFDSMTAEKGTPIFSVELPRGDLLKPEIRNLCLSNLENVLVEIGVIKGNTMVQKQPIPVIRNAIYTPTMGIWNPAVELMSHVYEGQVIGTLNPLPDLTEILYRAPTQGLVLQIRPEEVVKPNSIVFAIGTLDKDLGVKIASINKQNQCALRKNIRSVIPHEDNG